MPSSLRLFDIRPGDCHALKKTLPDGRYDFVVIDTAPTYDNLVMNALYAADCIFTPVQLDFFNLTTSRFLRAHLYDELTEQVGKWFIYYTFWQENLAPSPNSVQSQYAAVFEGEFDNILKDIQVPKTPATAKYTQTDKGIPKSIYPDKASVRSQMLGSQRLAAASNRLANLVTQTEARKDEDGNEIFPVEKF